MKTMLFVFVFLAVGTCRAQVINSGQPVKGVTVTWLSAQSSIDSAYNVGVIAGRTVAQARLDSAYAVGITIGLQTPPDSILVQYTVTVNGVPTTVKRTYK